MQKLLTATVLAVLLGSSAQAATLVYNTTSITGSVTNYPGDVVESFTVNQAGWEVTALAAFDSAAKSTLVPNGITSDIYVGLYNDTTQSFVTITGNAKVITTTGTNVGNPPGCITNCGNGPTGQTVLDFNGTAYNGTGGSYFVTQAITPVVLIDGDTYSIEAWGFNTVDGTAFNSSGEVSFTSPAAGVLTNILGTAAVGNGATNIDALNKGGLVNAICHVSTSSCESVATDALRFNGTNAFAGGSLELTQTPIPAALPLFASGLVAMGLFGRRRKRKASTVTV